MLNRATCRLVVRQRSTLWIRGSWSRRPPAKRAFFSKVGLFRSCAPDRPNLEKRRAKAGPTQISKQISQNLRLGQAVACVLQCTDFMHWSAQITHEDRSRRSRSQVHATGVPTSLLSRSASATPAQSGRPARHLGSLRTLPVRFAGRDANKVCLSIVLAEGRSEVQPPSWTSCQVGALAVDG